MSELSDERYTANRRVLAEGRDLLAELEQAERELRECRASFAEVESAIMAPLEAHLAAVPALVEALRQRAIENGACPVCEHSGISFYTDGVWTESWAHFTDCPVHKWEQAQAETT